MGNVLTLPEQRVVLENVRWETYEHSFPTTWTSLFRASPLTGGGWRS